MDFRLVGSTIGFVIGVALGGSMGVAAGGGAVNGAYVFGPIGAIVGFLLARRKLEIGAHASDEKNTDTLENGEMTGANKPLDTELPEENMSDLAETAEGLFDAFVRLLCSFWNLQMKFLLNVGLMPHLVSKPWIFVIIGFMLLAVFPPLGTVFCLSAFAAMSKGMDSENNFMVLKE